MGTPLSAPPLDSTRALGNGMPAASAATTPRRGGKAQRAAERERIWVASAVKAIGQQNREHAAIVRKVRRVTP
ncbi:MAG TPA: hypothetical protein VGD37_05370 [Kofleriaceae bacterium]